MAEWKYRKDGVECGPVTGEQLIELVNRGEIRSGDIVRTDGSTESVSAAVATAPVFAKVRHDQPPPPSHSATGLPGKIASQGKLPTKQAKPHLACPVCRLAVQKLRRHLRKAHRIQVVQRKGVTTFLVGRQCWVLRRNSVERLGESDPPAPRRAARKFENGSQISEGIRLDQLAKELGVESSVILDKLRNEGLAGTANHTSTLPLGLAETVREWYGKVRHVRATPADTTPPIATKSTKYLGAELPMRNKHEAKQHNRDWAFQPQTAERLRQRVQKIEQTASEWLSGPQGQEELTRVKATLLAGEVLKDGDLFAKACKEALTQQIEKWLSFVNNRSYLLGPLQESAEDLLAKDVV